MTGVITIVKSILLRPRGIPASRRWGNTIRTYAYDAAQPTRQQELKDSVEEYLDESWYEELFQRMPIFRFEDWGLYQTPEGYRWSKGGYPDDTD